MNTHRRNNEQTNAAPAYVANGLVGLRVPVVPLQGTAMLNGYVERRRDLGLEAADLCTCFRRRLDRA